VTHNYKYLPFCIDPPWILIRPPWILLASRQGTQAMMVSRRSWGAGSSKQRHTMTAERFVPDSGTYTQLIKPSLNSACSPIAFWDADDWEPSLTLGWSNRGIGSSKISSVRDTLLSNVHLTGVRLAGEREGSKA
jgi:hypothetical protein